MKFLRAITDFMRRVFARYEGATFSPQRSTVPGALTSARFDVNCHSREEIARKVRYFERNNPLVQALAGKFENFVVGANPQLTPTSSDPAWNKAAKAWWDTWCLYPDLSSRQTFGTLMSLVARSWFIDGDIFIILTQGEMRGGKSFPRIQLVEGHLCKTPVELKDDPMVIDGVRVDKNGRPVEFYFGEEKKQGQLTFQQPKPADAVIHVFEPSRPGQPRGISFFHAAINVLHDIDDLMIFEMQAAKENASTKNWIKTANGELPPGLQGTTGRFSVTKNVTTNAGATASETKQEYYRAISGGTARVLQHGDEVNQNPGQRPSVTTVEFWKFLRQSVCAAVEIPHWMIFPEDVQGTAYRGELDMATACFKSRHAVLADVMRRIYEYVMRFAIATDPALALRPDDWRRVSIVPPRAPNVDVGRNDAAESQALKDGRTNYALIYGPRGLDWREELLQANAEEEFIEENCPALARRLAVERGGLDVPIEMGKPRQMAVTE